MGDVRTLTTEKTYNDEIDSALMDAVSVALEVITKFNGKGSTGPMIPMLTYMSVFFNIAESSRSNTFKDHETFMGAAAYVRGLVEKKMPPVDIDPI